VKSGEGEKQKKKRVFPGNGGGSPVNGEGRGIRGQGELKQETRRVGSGQENRESGRCTMCGKTEKR